MIFNGNNVNESESHDDQDETAEVTTHSQDLVYVYGFMVL